MQSSFYDVQQRNATQASQRAHWLFTAAIAVGLEQFWDAIQLVLGKVQACTGAPWSSETGSCLAAVATLAVMTCLFHGVRREERLVAKVLQLAAGGTQETRSRVYYALLGAQLFTHVDRRVHDPVPPWSQAFARVLSHGLVFFPLASLVFGMAADLLDRNLVLLVLQGMAAIAVAWLSVEVRRLRARTEAMLVEAGAEGWGRIQAPWPTRARRRDETGYEPA